MTTITLQKAMYLGKSDIIVEIKQTLCFYNYLFDKLINSYAITFTLKSKDILNRE